MFGQSGQYQQILKEVDVPIVAPGTCQSQMQAARLGASFVLDTTSFICAGGEANKDACTVSNINEIKMMPNELQYKKYDTNCSKIEHHC